MPGFARRTVDIDFLVAAKKDDTEGDQWGMRSGARLGDRRRARSKPASARLVYMDKRR